MIEYAIPVTVRNKEMVAKHLLEMLCQGQNLDKNASIKLKLEFTEKPDKVYLANMLNKHGKVLIADVEDKYEIECDVLFLNGKSAIVRLYQDDIDKKKFPLHLLYEEMVDSYLVIKTLEKEAM